MAEAEPAMPTLKGYITNYLANFKAETIDDSSMDVKKRNHMAVALHLQSHCYFKAFIQSAGERPLLTSYQSDGWGIRLRKLYTSGSTRAELRYGSYIEEYLNERIIAKKIMADGKIQMTMKCCFPRIMGGRKAWHVFAAQHDHQLMLPLLHPQGISCGYIGTQPMKNIL